MASGETPQFEIPDPLPKFFGDLEAFLRTHSDDPGLMGTMRIETMRRIEDLTERPLLCYATDVSPGSGASIDEEEIIGFGDLIHSVDRHEADVFIVSNGGLVEAAERVVAALRRRFTILRFIVPSNAFSAATLMCLSGNRLLMLPEGSLGPIDPQVNGVPVRAILRGFEELEDRLKEEGAKALPAYLPLLVSFN